MIDTSLAFTEFERNTATDPFFNAKDESVRLAANMIRNAISNNFTIKYNNTTTVALGFYSNNDYNITYPYNKERISVKTNRVKFVDYFFLRNSHFEFYKYKKKNRNKYLESWLISDCFFAHCNLPKNKDFYLIWRTEVYLDNQLYKAYDQKIRFVYRDFISKIIE